MPKLKTLYDGTGRAVLVNPESVTAIKSAHGLLGVSTIYLAGGGFIDVKGTVFDVMDRLAQEEPADA